MKEFISEIIKRFGGRYNGSEAEENAQIFVKEKMEKFCDKVEIIPFYAALEGHFQSLKIFVLIHLLILFILPFNAFAAMLFGLSNTLLFLGHFVSYRHWLDFLFKKKKSTNVVGDIEALCETKRTIIFAGHIDSVREFKWWYKWKEKGIALTVIGSFSIVLLGIFSVVAFFANGEAFVTPIWWIFILISPSLITLFDMHGELQVDGANDNLTGIALTMSLGEYFAKNRLQNTRIRIISFGAEESGLRGANAYAKQHKKQLQEEKALLINLDTIKDEEFLTIATNELNTLSFFDKHLIQDLKKSFDAMNVPVKTLPLTVGASDASAFMMNGLPALSLIGMTTEKLDKTYHTRLDNLEHLNDQAMMTLKKVLVHYVEEGDR